jgi:putative ABC transport system permease protein
MMFRNILTESLQSLGSNRLRSALTMLGIIWGTASVVFLLGWGQGFVKVMKAEARAVGDGFIIIWPKQARSEISGRRGARQLHFELKDVDAVLAHCPSVRYVTPVEQRFGLVMKSGSNLKPGNLVGVNSDACNIFNLSINRGRFLQPPDIDEQRRVIVLAADLVEGLFPAGSEAVGRWVKVHGVTYEVIGVLKRKGDTLVDWGGRDDEKAYIPITSFQEHISGHRYVGSVFLQPRNIPRSKDSIEEVRSFLAKKLKF